ncbi:MAG: hypothetical protein KatS3mg105_2885 [Gemmatales bacterium]|nr:MAG: hypothetical protein KatS3mg105_2885 [Gemmatales bacterium]
MAISIRCGQCGQGYRVPDEAVGRRIKCRKCSTIITIAPAETAPTEAFTAAPPMPAVAAMAAPGPRRRSRSRLLPITVAGSLAVLFLVGAFLAARWLFGGYPLGPGQKYLPDKPNFVGVFNVPRFVESDLYSELKKLDLLKKTELDDYPASPEEINRIISAGQSNDDSVVVIEAAKALDADKFKEQLKKQNPQIKTFKEEKVGSYTVVRYPAKRIPRTFQEVGNLVAGGQASEPEYTEAFCLPEKNIAVLGKFEALKPILQRDSAPEFSKELQAAMGRVDFSQAVAFAGVLNKKLDKKDVSMLSEDFVEYVNSVEEATAVVDFDEGVDAQLTVRFSDEKKAKTACDLANGGIAAAKTFGKMPKEMVEIFDAISLKHDGKLLIGRMKISTELIVNAVKAAK